MAALTLALLGPPQVARADGTAVVRARKELALLAYLAVERRHPHSRDTLLGMFWPESPEEAARNSLRVALANLRAALGEAAEPCLLSTRHSVQFSTTSDYTLDVAAFGALLAERRVHCHEDGALCAECAARLTQAIALYRGDFLSGFALPDSTSFEEWALVVREQLHQQAIEALDTLAVYHDRQGDYPALSRAARRQIELEPWREPAHRQLMRALAVMGERAAALAAYERCREVLEAELGVDPDAETRALYERISTGELSPLISSAPAPALSSPAHLTPFVGRENELAEIAARLRQADVRLLTLVGAGGMGKTRLAQEVQRHADPSSDQPDQVVVPARPPFPDGVFFVSLAPLTSTAAIAPAIASAISLSFHGDPKQALLRFLTDKQLLLILDNFEHLLDGVELVLEILQSAPLVKLIATSRERLKVRGEHIYVVEGMDYQAEDSAASSAIELFVQSARRVLADFKVSDEKLPLLLHICDLVQGMPLGIELAAAWVEMLPLEMIAAEIERSADFLAFDWRDAPERQRSMRAVFDWSWHLLNEAEQQALRGLSVFRGGCTLEAAQAVVNASLRVLTSLVHKSLLRWSWAQGKVGRYEMHELLRQLAAEQLDITPAERAALEARHSAFYLTFVAERETRLAHYEPNQAAEEIRGEIDNVRQAWAWAATQTHISELARSVYGLWQFYWLTGLSSEGEQAFGLAAECVRRRMSALESAQEARNCHTLSSKLLAGQAHFMNLQAKYDHAIPLAQQAVALGEASRDHIGAAMGYVRWGQALFRKGLCIDARPHFERALHFARVAQSIGPDSESLSDLEWDALVWLGFVATSQGDYDEARTHLAQGLRICQTLGNRRGECRCFIDTGEIAMTVGDYAAASTYFQAALRLAHEHGNLWYEGMAHLFLGMVAFAEGNYTLASNSTEAALNTFHNIGDPAFEAWALAGFGRLADSLGDYAHARDWLDQSLYLSQKVGAWEAQFYGCAFLALVLHHLGDDETACRCAEQSRRIALEAGDRSRQADAWLALGRTHEGLNRLTDAVSAYQYASALYAELGRAHMVTEPRAGLARIALVQGDLMQAQTHIEDILTFLENHPLIGPDEPFMIYLTCYRVLEASGDVRAASLLRRAEQRLRECAEHITDDALRRSFLENVAAHHAILTVAHTTAPPVGVS